MMMRSRKKEEREKKVRKEPKTRRKSKKNVSKDEKESEKRGRHPACARRPFDMTRLDVRELVRAARKQKESSDGGEAAARRKREERAMIIDRATRAAAAIAERASTSESDPLKKVALATDVLEGVCYWPDFVSEEEEASLVAAVDLVSEGRWIGGEESDDRFAAAAAATATATATATPSAVLPAPGRRRRRRANFGGSPSQLASSEELPQFLQSLCDALTRAGAFAAEQPANHVLVNDYANAAGLPRHRDGPLYAASATITLCGSAALELHRTGEGKGEGSAEAEKTAESGKERESGKQGTVQLLLRPRAALSLRGESYESWEHGVPAVGVDIIRDECANCGAAGVRVGERVPRSARRISLVSFPCSLCCVSGEGERSKHKTGKKPVTFSTSSLRLALSLPFQKKIKIKQVFVNKRKVV